MDVPNLSVESVIIRAGYSQTITLQQKLTVAPAATGATSSFVLNSAGATVSGPGGIDLSAGSSGWWSAGTLSGLTVTVGTTPNATMRVSGDGPMTMDKTVINVAHGTLKWEKGTWP